MNVELNSTNFECRNTVTHDHMSHELNSTHNTANSIYTCYVPFVSKRGVHTGPTTLVSAWMIMTIYTVTLEIG